MKLNPRAPYWITTKYGGVCSQCKQGIKKGEDVLYYPNTKKVLCRRETCGQRIEREAKERREDIFWYGRSAS